MIRFAYEGKDMEIELNGTKISNGSSHELEASDSIVVTVTDLDGQSVTYTFNIAALTPASYVNTTVVGLNVAAADGYSDTDWNDGDDVTLDTSAKTFDFPFLQTGDAAMDKAQVEEAVEFYNETNTDDVVLSNIRKVGSIWYVSANGVDMQFDPSSSKVLVYTKDGTTEGKKIVASSAKVVTDVLVAATGDGFHGVTEIGEEMAPVKTPTTDVVIPGATYTKDAYVMKLTVPADVTTAAVISGDAGATSLGKYTYSISSAAYRDTNDYYLQKDEELTVTIKFDGAVADTFKDANATKTDTITVAATGCTVDTTATFSATTTDENLTQTVTVTGPGSATATATMTIKGSNA